MSQNFYFHYLTLQAETVFACKPFLQIFCFVGYFVEKIINQIVKIIQKSSKDKTALLVFTPLIAGDPLTHYLITDLWG